MPTVRLVSAHDLRFLLRQTPAGDGLWGSLRVTTGPDPAHDWLLVVDAPPKGLTSDLPGERRIVMLTEPPAVRDYPLAYLAQFGTVIGPAAPPGFTGRVIGGHPCMPWFYGLGLAAGAEPRILRDWATLWAGPASPRTGLISAVCSTKLRTPDHIRRLRFLRLLGGTLGTDLTVFGRGFRPLGDKAEGIDGFRYHLVLENNLDPGFWTEKLADAILGGAFPIVAGGGGLSRWFDPAGFAEIDLRRPRASVEQVKALLAADPAAKPEVQAAMAANRERLMTRHQLFPVLAASLDTAAPRRLPAAITLHGPAGRRHGAMMRPLRLAVARLVIALTERG